MRGGCECRSGLWIGMRTLFAGFPFRLAFGNFWRLWRLWPVLVFQVDAADKSWENLSTTHSLLTLFISTSDTSHAQTRGAFHCNTTTMAERAGVCAIIICSECIVNKLLIVHGYHVSHRRLSFNGKGENSRAGRRSRRPTPHAGDDQPRVVAPVRQTQNTGNGVHRIPQTVPEH